MTRRLKLKPGDVNWARVADICYRSKLGQRLSDAESEYCASAYNADPPTYSTVQRRAAAQAQDDYVAAARGKNTED